MVIINPLGSVSKELNPGFIAGYSLFGQVMGALIMKLGKDLVLLFGRQTACF